MGAAVNDVLVSISCHPLDESIPIPYIGVRGPLSDILMPEWQVRNIVELKTFAVRFASLEGEAEPEPVPAVAEAAPEAPALESAPTSEPVPAVAEVESLPNAAPEAPALASDAPTEQTDSEMTPEEVVALRDRILSLTTVRALRTLAAEFGLELPPTATKLEDIRAALLAPVEAALAAE